MISRINTLFIEIVLVHYLPGILMPDVSKILPFGFPDFISSTLEQRSAAILGTVVVIFDMYSSDFWPVKRYWAQESI